jgi:class 3 adenylate cyclase
MEAERRQVTILFADMMGFTSFSERSGEGGGLYPHAQPTKLMDEAVRERRGFIRGFKLWGGPATGRLSTPEGDRRTCLRGRGPPRNSTGLEPNRSCGRRW